MMDLPTVMEASKTPHFQNLTYPGKSIIVQVPVCLSEKLISIRSVASIEIIYQPITKILTFAWHVNT